MDQKALVDRIKAEQAELAVRLDALGDFIENKADALVSTAHKDMLAWQYHAMKLYHHILGMRLTDLQTVDITDFKTTRVASEKEVGIGELEQRYNDAQQTTTIGEPVEIGGHDESRDGPVPFNG